MKAQQVPVDPFPNPVLAPTDAAGTQTNGARFGCSRNDGSKMHYGIDLKADVGTSFVAIYDGTVFMTRTNIPNDQATTGDGGLGNWIIVKTDNPPISIKYCHLSIVSVNPGDAVTQTSQLGLTGRSGNAFNVPFPHLHLEVSTDNFSTATKRVDPEPYLKTQYGPNPNPPTCANSSLQTISPLISTAFLHRKVYHVQGAETRLVHCGSCVPFMVLANSCLDTRRNHRSFWHDKGVNVERVEGYKSENL